MNIEKIIIESIELSKATKIPVLFMSNPGLGKTTTLTRYAQHNKMHLETLIGSRFTPEEINGYMVNNGGDHLQHLSPEWYSRILSKKNEGITTILFIDELSTCSESVQGSLLSLIFDRSIGNGKMLPDDCIIVAAANYVMNLSPSMNILSPTLNRFTIINLNQDYTALDLTEEFLSFNEKNDISYDKYFNNAVKLSPEKLAKFTNSFKCFWKDTFIKYCDPQSSLGILDISNQELGGIYSDSEGPVYNFISGRTLSYLQQMLIAYIELNINDSDLLYKLTDGLVGNGTCSFKEPKQAENYRKYLHIRLEKLVQLKEKDEKPLPKLTNNVSKDISAYLIGKENLEVSPSSEITHLNNLMDEISKRFSINNIISIKNAEETASFTSDFEALLDLYDYTRNFPSNSNINNTLIRYSMDYYALYCNVMGTEMNFIETFGIDNHLFANVCIYRTKESSGEYVYKRAALRFPDRYSKPALYELKGDSTLLEARLQKVIHTDGEIDVLIFDNGFKFIPFSTFAKEQKKKSA